MVHPVQGRSLAFLPGLPKCGAWGLFEGLPVTQNHSFFFFFCYLRMRLYTSSQTWGQTWESENTCLMTLTFSSSFQLRGAVVYF